LTRQKSVTSGKGDIVSVVPSHAHYIKNRGQCTREMLLRDKGRIATESWERGPKSTNLFLSVRKKGGGMPRGGLVNLF